MIILKEPDKVGENCKFNFVTRRPAENLFINEGKTPLRVPSFNTLSKSMWIIFVSCRDNDNGLAVVGIFIINGNSTSGGRPMTTWPTISAFASIELELCGTVTWKLNVEFNTLVGSDALLKMFH